MRTKTYLIAALLALCSTQINAQCNATGSHYTASYPAGWTLTDNGDGLTTIPTTCNDENGTLAFPAGNAMFFRSARDGREMRLSRAIPVLSDQTWTMDFIVQITPTSGGALVSNSPAVTLASLTADQQSLQVSCTGGLCASCGSYPNTNMDAMWVAILSEPPISGCSEPQTTRKWQIGAFAREGSNTPMASTPIAIPSGATGTYYIRLQRTGADRAILGVYSNPSRSTHLAGSPQCFAIPSTVTGLDCLNHEADPRGYCARVFNGIVSNLKIDNGLTCTGAPSFTTAASVCQGDNLTMNVPASPAGSVTNYTWAVQECDVNGTVFGNVWVGFNSGTPPLINTISPAAVATAGVNMQCGHYYKVTLEYLNCTTPYSQVVSVTCPPAIQMSGSSTMICTGGQGTLTPAITGGSGNYTLIVEQLPIGTQTIYSGPPVASVAVTPITSTSYRITAIDNATGCTTYSNWTVNVSDVDPAFSLSVNSTNPNYFTLTLTPNDLNGQSYPGFGYGITVEEMNGSTPYYWNSSLGSTTCWWNYPNPETFLGFVSTGTGTYTQASGSSGCGTIGQFLYNHTYRITRMVLNSYCAPEYYSTIVTTVKSGEVIVIPDTKVPDMSHWPTGLATEGTDSEPIHIFPNPSTGIFTIALGEGAESSLIEVTNALGQQVKSFETKEQQSELDMTGYTKGIYIVTIVSNGNTTTKKIMLE